VHLLVKIILTLSKCTVQQYKLKKIVERKLTMLTDHQPRVIRHMNCLSTKNLRIH